MILNRLRTTILGPRLRRRWGNLVALVWAAAATVALLPTDAWSEDSFRFAELVKLKPAGGLAAIAGADGTLATGADSGFYNMRLSNVSIGGEAGTTDLRTRVNRESLVLESSVVYDLVKGEVLRQMKRKTAKSDLDGQDTDVFEFTEISSNNKTTTEPYVEFKVADFLSVILIAADAIHRKETKPIDLSMLRDRSVRRVTVTFGGPKTVGGRSGTLVKVAPPDNPAGGITYVIARTQDGRYYPAQISAQSEQGLVELEGVATGAK